LIVKFKANDQVGVTDDVRTCLSQGRSFATATADGSPSLDTPFKRHGVFGASSLVRGREGLTTGAAKVRIRGHVKRAALAKARSRFAPVEELVNVYRLDLPTNANLETVMADLRNDPHVEYVHPNYVANLVYSPNDPYLGSYGSWGQPRADLWNLDQIHVKQAWDVTRGAGVVVAVVDTGVDINHLDLAGNIWTNLDEIPNNGIDDDANGYIDDVHGWSIIGNNNLPDDYVGHGTHVAGTIAAQDNNSLGVVGIAPDAQIMPVQVFSGRTVADVFTLSQGILYAAQNGADVINNSWEVCQTSCPSAPIVEDAVRTAHAAGSVVIFAAGNEETDIRFRSPQNQPEAIVVTATTPQDSRAVFSNFGLVDVAAPGSGDPNDSGVTEAKYGILSLRAEFCSDPYICTIDRNVGDAYVRLAGTSMAAPHVSGAAALILAQHPNYTPEQVRQVLRRGTVDSNANGYDSDLGYGRIDTALSINEPVPLEALIQLPVVVETSQVVVAGSANGDQFKNYILEFGIGVAPTTWTTVASNTSAVRSGTLGTWDASKLADGDYTLRLRVYKTNGAVYEDRHQLTLDRISLKSPVNTAVIRGSDISIQGIANPGTFKSYALRVQELKTGANVTTDITLPNGGRLPVTNGVLGVWHAQNVKAEHYRLFLDVTLTDGSVITENVMLIVDSMLHAGWPVDLTSKNRRVNAPVEHVTLVDLQGDGPAEILGGWSEQVSVFKGDGTLLTGWPQYVTTQDNPWLSISSMPIAGDIDGDGVKEVIAANNGGMIFVWAANGTLKPGWPRTIANNVWSMSLSLGDVDRNGILDIVATEPQTGVYVYRGNGTPMSGWPALIGYGIKGPATVADLNRDGKAEVVVGLDSAPAKLFVLNSQGSILPGWPQTIVNSSNESQGSYPVVGDVDDDGDLEIVAVSSSWDETASKLVIYHHNGQKLNSWLTNATTMGPPILADLDGDGSLEILSSLTKSDNTASLYVWDRYGNVLPGWPQSNISAPDLSYMMFNAPIVVDLDGDGRSEVISSRLGDYWSTELEQRFGHTVQAFRFDGTLIPEMARPAYGAWPTLDASPGIADIDADGKLELVWTEQRDVGRNADVPWPRLYAWDLTTPATNAQPWPMYRADAQHSGQAKSVVPIVKLTQRNVVRRVNGLGRFLVHSGTTGVIQLRHPWQAVVKYAVGNELLTPTNLGWGAQISVPPNQDIKLRVVTTSAIDVTIDWW
jgi:subtilisin family serine protease